MQPQTRNNGAIAQLVEQRTENPCVPGSIPGGTTRKNFSLLKSSEIQQFRGIFLFLSPTKKCRFKNLKMSHSVVFHTLLKKTTTSFILHLFSTIYTIIFQALKSTFADLLECGKKEIGRKEKNAVSRKYKFPKEIPVFLFRWFSRKNSVVFISFK